ncbi:MAG: FdhF/YdeP family oxidoreductase [Cryomorphaceae bacterium]|nr:FdhF/YdeP family oxidoreductase [Cryomorphaceae bacterium]
MKRSVHLIPPDKLTGLRITRPSEKAAGIKGVTVAMQHLSREMGFWKGMSLMTRINQKGGIDCPGCAWPDPNHRAKLFEYCENGAKAIAEEATNKRVTPNFFAEHTIEELSGWSDYDLGKSGRLTHPMYAGPDDTNYREISWEDAVSRIADKLKSIHPDEAVFYTSGRTSNEAAFLYQLMIRNYGTNNLPDCSNMCHESSGVGLTETVGIGKGSVALEDLYEAEVIMVMGQNPGTNHPRMLSAMEKCKSNGGTIIQVNPLPEVGTQRFVDPQSPMSILKGGVKLSDHFLQVRINGDIALLKLLMLGLLEEERSNPGHVLDREFIIQHTSSFEEFRSELLKIDEQQALKDCGLTKAQLTPIIRLLAQKKKIIICWAMGITQQKNGVENVREIVNLLLMKGSIGKPGAGTCPVRGHSNVQGDRTMGIYEKPSKSFLDSLDNHFKISSPREIGYDTVEAIDAMAEGKVRLFFAMGGNFISAAPDSEFTAKAMECCDMTVQVSTKLNRSHIVTGKEAIILPCLARTDVDVTKAGVQFETVENSMGIVHRTKGSETPPSPLLRSESAIVCDLAMALFGADNLSWAAWKDNYDLIRNDIEAVIPGFEEYNRRVRQPLGFYLPNGARERKFNTTDGKAAFSINELPQVSPQEAEFVMMTIRSHDQYNTTIYGMDDRYRGVYNERRVVFMSQEDIEAKGLKAGAVVNLESVFQGIVRKATRFQIVPYSIPKGCIATYFPECNALVPLHSKAKGSNTPSSKYVEVNVYPG